MSVTIYVDSNYKGAAVTLGVGNYPSLKGYKVGNDIISSMKVDPGCQCLAYIDENYRGAYRVFTGDVPYVGNDFNDKISSLQVQLITPDNTYPAMVYKDANYGGATQQLKVGDYSTVGSMSVGNDQISSIKVLPGYRLIGYVDINFQGPFCVWEGNVAYVGDQFNDKISSIRVVQSNEQNQVVATAYVDTNCSGDAQQFFLGDYPDLTKLNLNDKISSIRINPGYQIIAYFDINYGGPFHVWEGNVAYVGNQFNDKISSLKIFKGAPNQVLATAYVDMNYGGPFCVWEGDVGYVGNQFNDKISSLRVVKASEQNQVIATVYVDIDYGGDAQQLFLGRYPNLINLNMDKKISSIKVTPGYLVVAHVDRDFQGDYRIFSGQEPYVHDFNDKTSSLIVAHSIWDIAQVPTAPSEVHALITAPNALCITWRKPSFDGYIPIRRYEVWNSKNNAWVDAGLPSTGNNDTFTYTFVGITTNSSYQLKIRAINDKGAGAESVYSVTTGDIPSAPTSLRTADGISGQIILSWSPPARAYAGTNTAGVNYYQVSSDGGNSWLGTTSDLKYTFSGLTIGQTYTFAVRAVNVFGEGPPATIQVAAIIFDPRTGVYQMLLASGNPSTLYTGTFYPMGFPVEITKVENRYSDGIVVSVYSDITCMSPTGGGAQNLPGLGSTTAFNGVRTDQSTYWRVVVPYKPDTTTPKVIYLYISWREVR